MKNGIGLLSWVNVKSALVYGLVAGVLATVAYMLSVGDVFVLDWKLVLNNFVFGFLTSVVKNMATTNEGNFLGVTKVIPPTE